MLKGEIKKKKKRKRKEKGKKELKKKMLIERGDSLLI